jgi:cytidine deaminase
MDKLRLVDSAADVRRFAYVPYSNFPVGAALLTKSNRIFVGCNVENISLGLTICAEQAALSAAVANGDVDLVAAAVVSDSKEPIVPCGRCRQLLAEFNPKLEIISSTIDGQKQILTLEDLLPRPKQGILEAVRNVRAAD